jgi:hypothetical protein
MVIDWKESAMLINDIKKGAKVRLSDGTIATVQDNKKGLIRNVTVPTLFRPGETSYGTAYAFRFKAVKVGDQWESVELTEAQQKKAARIRAMGF